MKKKSGLTTLLLAALALSFTLFVFAPIAQYTLNQAEMWFGLGEIVPPALLCFALLTGAVMGLGYLLPPGGRRFLTAAVIGLALCFYLQGNVLNPDYGELDGRAVDWGAYTLYAAADTVLWLGLVAGAVVLALKKRRLFKRLARWLSAFLLLIQAGTLAAVLLSTPIEDKALDWIVSDKDQFALGETENTVMFVVDACDSTYLPRIREEAPDALAELDGFTWFSDYAGSYSKTKMGFPYLMTGQWYENDETIEGYIERCYEDTPLYRDLRAAGWDVRLYTAETYMSSRMAGVADNVIPARLTVGSRAGLFGKMMQFVAFRYMPHVCKPAFVFYSGEFGFYKAAEGEHQPYFKDNFIFRDQLLAQGLTQKGERALVVYHINGSHLPCNMDAQGVNVGSWNTTALEQTKGVFRTIIAPYLAQMKALGLYDSANIIITADHGRFDEGPSSPVMLIKPSGARGELRENTAMASVSDLQSTLRALSGLEYTGESLLELSEEAQRERRYLYYPTTRANGGTLPPLEEYRVERGQAFVKTGVVLPGGEENIR